MIAKCWRLSGMTFVTMPLGLALSTSVYALTPIGEQQGWRGYVTAGVGTTAIKSNTLAGNDIINGGKDTIGSINDSPRSTESGHGVALFEVNYTFENRNQVFLGSSLQNQLTMDFGSQLGWRKQTKSTGIFQLGYLFTSIPGEVWEDPYEAGVKRKETERDSDGARFVWGNIMGSAFEFTAQVRQIDVDNERSGSDPSLGCDSSCQSLLNRSGDQYQLWLSYTFIQNGRHIFRPQLRYRQNDYEGDAVSRDAYALQLSYSYMLPRWIFVASAVYGNSSFDRPNPLHGIKQDTKTTAIDATVLYRLPIKGGRWQIMGSAFWGNADSDINFHDSKLSQIMLGVIYNFGLQSGL